MPLRSILIALFKWTGYLAIPLYTFLLFLFRSRTAMGFLFFLGVTLCTVKRTWETFGTSNKPRKGDVENRWKFLVVTVPYISLFFLLITEFYFKPARPQFFLTALGCILLTISWKLGSWSHAALADNGGKERLVRTGPYRYMRHPMHLGIMAEELAYPCIVNAGTTLLFASLVCIPLVVVGGFIEERILLRRFGGYYEEFKKQAGMFLPTQLLRR